MRYKPPHHSRLAGFTLLELLVTIAIASILLSTGVPSFRNFFDTLAVKGAGEQVYSHIQQARSEAISRKQPIGVHFSANGSSTWAYGLSDLNTGNSSCDPALTDPAEAQACTLVIDDGDGTVHGANGATDAGDKVLKRFTSAAHDGVRMSLANFTHASGIPKIVFEPVRGTAMDSAGGDSTGNILLVSEGGRKLLVKVSILGQVRVCSPDGSVSGYRDAAPADDTDC
ncbi:hypothetical protein Maes01_02765 [Microbulbifer aestuariivivens]|uniref:Type II secretion system protein H n=1 Tax=Microbulbifer aestuariivivens TaxID=1908308 RepID=A0ABP9WSV2_9GAMM